MKTLSTLVVLSMVLAACGGSTIQATLVDPDTASKLIDDKPDLEVLDIRTPEEAAGGTLPGAKVIGFYSPTFQQEISALDRAATYLVYCRSGNRSAQATRMMTEMGFVDVYELEGGVVAWVNAGQDLSPG